MEAIRQPLDFLGVNLYQADAVRRGKNGHPEVVPFPTGSPVTSMEWAVTPAIMHLVPSWLYERYRLPIVIAENGVSLPDWVAADGQVHDPQRIDFARAYLRELAAAVAGGVPVQGYFHWSLLDNFEWAHGYKQRFGLVHVDFTTQKRTPKDSARWYRDVIASNGARL
jgi:beta-glucosidase